MSFQEHLENIRTKPDHIRRRFSFLMSFGITAIIFIFWLGSYGIFNDTANNAVTTAVNKIGSPGQTLVASVESFFFDVRDLVFGPKKVIYSSIEVLPGRK